MCVALLSLCAWGKPAERGVNARECAQLRTPAACDVSATDLKNARQDFRQGMALQKSGKTQEAFDAFSAAARLVPNNAEYVTIREVLRQKVVMQHLNAGNALAAAHQEKKAISEFRQALALDPSNEFARQQLETSVPLPSRNLPRIAYIDSSGELQLSPNPGVHSFHFKGSARELVQNIALAFGVTPTFDESFRSKQVRFDVDNVGFWRAMQIAMDMTRSFWVPIEAKRMMVVADTAANRAEFERMTSRTFYLTDATTPQDVTDVLNVLRTMFDIRQITQQPGTSSIIVRAPQQMLDAATELLRSLDLSRPQVMLDFQVLQVNTSMMKDIGIDIPLQWQAFSLSSAALAALQQPNIQAQINQLLANGGLTGQNATALAGLIQQLQNQQNSLSSLLQNPFATFGGGSTRFAVPWPPSTLHFSLNTSRATTLDELSIRAGQGSDAIMKVGSRYPIVTAIYSAAYSTPAINQALQSAGISQNQANVAPFPSFTFEDLGLNVKVKPQIHESDVTLDLTLELKALSGQSFNGVPVISSRTYSGSLSVADGGTVVVAGSLDKSESKSLSGLPGVASVPMLNRVATHTTTQESDGELLILITPHILRRPADSGPAITVPSL
jgi:general secretion pathway protein D